MARTRIERLLEGAPDCSICEEYGEYVGVSRDDDEPTVHLRCTGCGFQYTVPFPGGDDAYARWVDEERDGVIATALRDYPQDES